MMYVLKLENGKFVKLVYAGESGDGQFEYFDVEEVSLKDAQTFNNKKNAISLAKDINFGCGTEYAYNKEHNVSSVEKVELKVVESVKMK